MNYLSKTGFLAWVFMIDFKGFKFYCVIGYQCLNNPTKYTLEILKDGLRDPSYLTRYHFVHLLSRFMHALCKPRMEVVFHVLCYLKYNTRQGLFFPF